MVYGTSLSSRLLLGTAGYPSPAVLAEAVAASGTDIITVSLRREGPEGAAFRDLLGRAGRRILPNTAGCHTAREAVTTAQMAREVFGTDWIKLEVIGHADTLQPDPFALVEAARILCAEGFRVFPYTTEDLIVGEKLVEAGCEVLMPWGRPSGRAGDWPIPTGSGRCGRIFRACRWWSMPGSARPARRRRRWRWAMTRCW